MTLCEVALAAAGLYLAAYVLYWGLESLIALLWWRHS